MKLLKTSFLFPFFPFKWNCNPYKNNDKLNAITFKVKQIKN